MFRLDLPISSLPQFQTETRGGCGKRVLGGSMPRDGAITWAIWTGSSTC
jgi:hypothetical protein